MNRDDLMNLAEQAAMSVGDWHGSSFTEAELARIVGQFAWLVFNEARKEAEADDHAQA